MNTVALSSIMENTLYYAIALSIATALAAYVKGYKSFTYHFVVTVTFWLLIFFIANVASDNPPIDSMQIEVGLWPAIKFGLLPLSLLCLLWVKTINSRLKFKDDLDRRLVTVENIEERGLSSEQTALFHEQDMSFQLSMIATVLFIATVVSLATS